MNVWVTPRASKNDVRGIHGDEIKIRVQAPALENKANRALIRFLSHKLGVSKRSVILLSGKTSRHKRIAVTDLSERDVRLRLGIE